MDLFYVIAVTVVCTVLAMALFINNFVQFESRFVQWFSHMTSQPRWFTIWILVMVLWVPLRHLLIDHGKLSSDGDFVVATILWSGVPFMVENLLKSTSAKQMNVLTELVVAIHAELDRSSERDETVHALLVKLLDAIEIDRTEGGES